MCKIDKIFEADNNNPEIQLIKKAMKEANDKRMYQRYIVILCHLKGETNKSIANNIDLCQHTVGTFIKKYKEDGITGLDLKHSPGAPRMLTKDQEEKLVDVITLKTPDEVGFAPRKNWTIAIIQQWVLKEYDVKYSHRGIAEVLYRLNLSYTRPTYTMAKANPEKQEAFKQEFEDLKKN